MCYRCGEWVARVVLDHHHRLRLLSFAVLVRTVSLEEKDGERLPERGWRREGLLAGRSREEAFDARCRDHGDSTFTVGELVDQIRLARQRGARTTLRGRAASFDEVAARDPRQAIGRGGGSASVGTRGRRSPPQGDGVPRNRRDVSGSIHRR
jgi:hypothetical protein